MGTFTLTHKTASSPSGLCPDQATVAVSVFSLQTPTIKTAGNVDRVCNLGTPLQLIPDVQGGLFGGVNNFGVSSAGLFVPSSGVIGENIISYSITSGPCVAYAQTTINVERFVPADLALTPKEFCRTDERVNLNSFVLHGGGTWSTNDSQKSLLGSMFDPRHGNSGGNNTFTYTTHSMPTPTLCPDTSSIRIVVNDVPVVTPLAYAEQFCSPEEVIFTIPNFPENEGESEWNFGDGSEPQKGNRLTHIYTTPGVYNVQLSFRNKGCTARATIENAVTVHESPKVDFSLPEEVLISNPEIQLTNLSTVLANNKYTWKITGLNDRAGEVHPRISFPKIGKYQVTLLAENEFGCKSELTKTLEVKNDFNIYIPTSFSPNFDRLNDEFKPVFSPYGLDLKSYEMEIFDRWGHAIYRTKDVNEGWNGRIDNKGEPMKEEVYIYRIKYKDLDGNSYNKMGHVSLIK
jgi:gliding motility-associated-like protein